MLVVFLNSLSGNVSSCRSWGILRFYVFAKRCVWLWVEKNDTVWSRLFDVAKSFVREKNENLESLPDFDLVNPIKSHGEEWFFGGNHVLIRSGSIGI